MRAAGVRSHVAELHVVQFGVALVPPLPSLISGI